MFSPAFLHTPLPLTHTTLPRSTCSRTRTRPLITLSAGAPPNPNSKPSPFSPTPRQTPQSYNNVPEPLLSDISPPPPTTPHDSAGRPDRPDDSDDDLATLPIHDKSANLWPPLRNRLLANPRLPLQLGVELTVGFVSKTLAEVQDRGENFWKMFDHYLCNLSLELVGDAMLVWLLSPVAGGAATLPKHLFQIGKFGVGSRVTGFLWKGLQFGVVGIASSAVGQGATRALVKVRGGDTSTLPEVLPNCLAWGGFLAASSNTRYQLINGFEQRVLEKVLPGGAVGAGVTFLVRFGNCYLGGLQWLPWTRYWGVQ